MNSKAACWPLWWAASHSQHQIASKKSNYILWNAEEDEPMGGILMEFWFAFLIVWRIEMGWYSWRLLLRPKAIDDWNRKQWMIKSEISAHLQEEEDRMWWAHSAGWDGKWMGDEGERRMMKMKWYNGAQRGDYLCLARNIIKGWRGDCR